MEKVTLDEVPHVGHPAGVNTVRRALSDALETTDVAVVYYELKSGDSFSGGLHRHHDQEELFYILSGEATFDVRESVDAETETVAVEAGETLRIPPGEFQYGYNDTDERVTALAIGAPKDRHDWEEVEWLTKCRDCGEEAIHDIELTDQREIAATCRDCGKRITTG